MDELKTTDYPLNYTPLYYTGNHARNLLSQSFSDIEKIVASSYGCDGLYTLISDLGNTEKNFISDDGFTILHNFIPRNEIDLHAKQMLLGATSLTNNVAGDATTLTTILSSKLGKVTLELVNQGKSRYEIIKTLDYLQKEVIKALDELTIEVTTPEQLHAIAKVSAKNDEIAKVLSDVFWEFKETNCRPFVTKNHLPFISSEVVNGVILDHSYIHNTFVDNNTSANKEIVLKDCIVVGYTGELKQNSEVDTLFTIATKEEKDVLIICSSVTSNIAQNIANIYRSKSKYKIYVFDLSKANLFDGIKQIAILKDLCANIGCELVNSVDLGERIEHVIASEEVYNLKTVTCKEIRLTQSDIFFDTDNRNTKALETRKAEIDHAFTDPTFTASEENLSFLIYRQRLLSHKMSWVKIGAATSQQTDTLYSKAMDCQASLIHSIKHGFVLGGTKTLTRIHKILDTEDFDPIAKEYLKQFSTLTDILIYNSHLTAELALVIKNDLEVDDNLGFDFSTHELVDLLEAEIFDSKKAVYQAIVNSISTAKSVIIENIFLNPNFYNHKQSL